MEIHKPKPIHNWRDFLKEVGIIVLGVSIALAAEQTVEYFHWRSEVAQARQALRAEITAVDEFYLWRVAIAPCLDSRLAKAQQAIDEIAAGHKIEAPDVNVRGTGALLSDSEWQSERSAQTLTHFPRQELAKMSRFYAQVPEFVTWETKEADAWWALRVLELSGEGIGAEDLSQLRLNLQVARHHGWLIELNARRMLAVSDALGVGRPRPDRERVSKFCTMKGADFARYLDEKEPR
jgi:hypothetical protein